MKDSDFKIYVDDLKSISTINFLEDHLAEMREVSPPESKHALGIDGLREPAVTIWVVYLGSELVACGGLKELDIDHAEIKSMRTVPIHRGSGIGSYLLQHLISSAREHGYRRLSLETGSYENFAPARALYGKYGFTYCLPFSDYKLDPNSVFMTKYLGNHEVTAVENKSRL